MKVLYFLPGTGVGGIGKFVKDIVSHMDNSVEFTFFTLGDPGSELSLFLNAHGTVINYPGWSRGVLKGLKKELSSHQYDIVHAHLGCWSFIVLYYAKRAGVRKRIAHSHSADNFKSMNRVGKVVYALSKVINPLVVTDYMACSDHACEETFGENVLHSSKYHRILNPVDERFFEAASHNVREELGISEDARIVCHVGYMGYHKNHPFILKLAESLKDKEIFWLLTGDGHSRQLFEATVKEKDLRKVYFLGIRDDIPDILKASDIFILPSLLEGLGTVVLEAQACGIPCIISENVTDETDMGLGLVEKISLKDIQAWENAVQNKNGRIISLEKIIDRFIENKVEITSCVQNILTIYCKVGE